METLKLDNRVAVPLVPRAAYRGRGGGRRPLTHLSQKTRRSGTAACTSATACR
ncbi:MAG: hypothetical protein ACO2PM_19840 [Pyrobaculum sp.]